MSYTAWGISPYKTVSVPLKDYNSDHYLTLVYHALISRGWHIDYFDHDGIMAYTNISWESYAEEISVRIIDNHAIIKSECVGMQMLYTDYGKNQKNIDVLLDEIVYVNFHLQQNLEQTTQEIMDSVPDKQFASLAVPPMGGKEKLHSFLAIFTPQDKYFVTPILVIVNIAVFIIITVAMSVMLTRVAGMAFEDAVENPFEKIYLMLGFSERSQVLNGQLWRLLTNTFLHFSFLHLLGNMVTLIYIGSIIESKLGRWNYLFLYLFTGITGSMVSVMWRENGISAGASGAIFGLFGIFLALLSTNIYERNVRKAMLISTVIFIVLNINPFRESIDHAAHFGGLVSGYIFGLIAYFGLTHKNIFLNRYGIPLIGTVIMAVFVVGGFIFTPNYDLKKFEQLIENTQTASYELNGYFYNYNDVSREQHLHEIETKGLSAIKKYEQLAGQFTQLSLPDKKNREAEIRAKIIRLQCRYYRLLYYEFKEKNYTKYRPRINKITEDINALRYKWGAFETED